MEFTKEQKQAIMLEGDSLLVSAAAGSGKTAVLAQRVIRKLTDEQNPYDADSLMVLTFTNAAADEMRRRISSILRDIVKSNPKNSFIKRQLALLPSAKICTIHSMCLDLVRQNFEKLGLDPQFTVAEQERLELMRFELMEDYVENLYERIDTDDEIKAVIDYFTSGRDDKTLFAALEIGCEFLHKEPFADKFIEFACNMPTDNVFDSLPTDYIFEYISDELWDILYRYDKLCRRARSAGFDKLIAFYDNERDGIARVKKFVLHRDFDMVVKTAKDVMYKDHPRRTAGKDEVLWSGCKDDRTELKERFKRLRDEFMYADSATILQDRANELKIIHSLLLLCTELNGIMLAERRRARLVSFDDAEKYALSLLVSGIEDERILKTDLALQLSEHYSEIIVDEFQDCSKIQNLIFSALSKDGKNIFAVGDVKQSIYRFRNAYPQLFLDIQQQSSYPDGERLCRPSKIDLNSNFRSHPKILGFVNAVFDPIMTKPRGGVSYADNHRLSNGGLYDSTDAASVTLSLLVSAGEEKYAQKSILEGEAKFVADKIKSIAGKLLFYDVKQQCERAVELSDIAILMRAPRTNGAIFEKILENEGIGCINNNPSEKYLDTPEVRDVLAYLQAIDNPYNDIPLITLMYSDYFNFTVNELGDIRAKNRGMLFFDAVKSYAANDNKTMAFVQTLENLRELSAVSDVYSIINSIYEQSGVLLRLGFDKDSESARANLMLLLDFAVQFESARFRGLFPFINYILKLIEKDQNIPAARLRKAQGCVSLLSIHGSKGLEFPVVFLVTSGNSIRIDVDTGILYDSALGVGGFVKDSVRHRDFSSFYRNAIKTKIQTDECNEYIRLLYVALTRACSHLFITAAMTGNDAVKAITQAYQARGSLSNYDIYSKPSFFKWTLCALINSQSAAPFRAFAGLPAESAEDDNLFYAEISRLYETDTQSVSVPPQKTTVNFDSDYVKKMITRKYQYEADTLIPAKLSVSEIKRAKDETPKNTRPPVPRFMQKGVTGADRGNATHRFLQFCDFKAITDNSSLEAEIIRLVDYEFITKRESELIEREKILGFLQSELMTKLRLLGSCKKEQRFLFTLPARQVTDCDSDEPVIVQGVIDCWYEQDGKAVIIDYKTDRVKTADELVARYGTQLEMYEKALLKLEGLKTAHKYIYSFCLSQFIEV